MTIAPLALAQHAVSRRCLRPEKDAVQVDRDDPTPRLRRYVCGGSVVEHTRAVHEHVDLSMTLDNRRHRLINGFWIGDVRDSSRRSISLRNKIIDNDAHGVGRPVVYTDSGAQTGEGGRRSQADA